MKFSYNYGHLMLRSKILRLEAMIHIYVDVNIREGLPRSAGRCPNQPFTCVLRVMSHNIDAYSYLPVDGTSIRDLRSTVRIDGTSRWSKEYLEQRRTEWEALGWTPYEHGTFNFMPDSLRITVQYPTSFYQVKNAVLASLFGTTSEIVKAITWAQEVKEQLEHAMTSWLPEHHNLMTYLSLRPKGMRYEVSSQHDVKRFRSDYTINSTEVRERLYLTGLRTPTRRRSAYLGLGWLKLTSDQLLRRHLEECLENTARLKVILDQLEQDTR